MEELFRPLGLLGRMGFTARTLEAFHRTPGGVEVMDCVCKHHLFRGQLARREPSTPLPVQWIVSSGRLESALSGLWFRSSAEWGPGMLGAGAVLQRTIAEARRLPEDAPERALASPLVLATC